MKGIIITKLDIIPTPGGDVMHGVRKSSIGFHDFGEVYFSWIEPGAIKAWKRHREMTLNLIVPFGAVKFVFFDGNKKFQEITISRENYVRITVSPMIWFGFQCASNERSLVSNIADIEHNPKEVDRKSISEIEYNWSK